MAFYVKRGLKSLICGLMWPLLALSCTIWVPNDEPIDCIAGTFGAYLDIGTYQSYSLFLPALSNGCEPIDATALSRLEWKRNDAVSDAAKREGGVGVLLPRGQCSFFAKATWADAATFNLTHGPRLLIVADVASTRGQAAPAGLVPAIAEWDRFGRDRELTVVGISAADGRRLRSLAEISTAVADVDRRVSLADEKTLQVHISLGMNSSNSEGADRRVDQCAMRALALVQGGLLTRATAVLDNCAHAWPKNVPISARTEALHAIEAAASIGILSAEDEDAAAREHLLLVDALHKAGLHGAAEQWVQALVVHGSRNEMSKGMLGSCYDAACQAHLRNGHAARARNACSSAHSLHFPQARTCALGDISQVLSFARLAALDFLLAGNAEDDCYIDSVGDTSLNPKCNSSRVEDNSTKSTTTSAAARASIERWQVASEAYRTLLKSKTTPLRHDMSKPSSALPQQQLSLQQLPTSLAAALSAKSSGGGGVGDATVWLLYTLAEEAASHLVNIREAASKAAIAIGNYPSPNLKASPDTGSTAAAAAARLLFECVDGQIDTKHKAKDEEYDNGHAHWPSSICGCLNHESGESYSEVPRLEAREVAAMTAMRDAGVLGLLLRLMDVHATLALFLDETGFFTAADRHLSIATGLANRACSSDLAMGVRFRRIAATPTIATSRNSMHDHRIKQLRQLKDLPLYGNESIRKTSRNSSGSSTVFSSVALFSDPLLAYTVTPSSMMIGYQGTDDPIATRALALAYARADPTLSEVARHLQPFKVTSEQPDAANMAQARRRRRNDGNKEEMRSSLVRVGFVSSYLRQHSVGRLMAGVIERLDSNQVEAHVFLATHFFKAHTVDSHHHTTTDAASSPSSNSNAGPIPSSPPPSSSSSPTTMKEARYTFQDPVTAALAAALGSDRVHVLPPPLPNGRHDHQRQGFDEAKVKPPNVGRPSAAALAMVADAQIDVLVYPELGMDAITVLMAMHRLAPIQMVFWGHPISQGLKSIDYFVSSDFYEPLNGGEPSSSDAATGLTIGTLKAKQGALSFSNQQRWGGGGGLRYHEQLIRMSGLGVYFEQPKTARTAATPKAVPAKDARRERVATLLKFGLPADCHLFFVPQTLMKFHPSFDEALANLLSKDPVAVIVITYSSNQPAWQAQLERRLASAIQLREASAAAVASTRDSSEAAAAGAAGVAATVNLLNATVLTSARVRFLPSLEHAAFLNLLQHADAVLDPWPFGGGVTSLEALSQGVPVVTLPSRQSVVQLAAGFYQRMSSEIEELKSFEGGTSLGTNSKSERTNGVELRDTPWPIATNEDHFVELAVAIAASMDDNPTSSKANVPQEAHALGLREVLKRRILATHGVLFEDESAAEEWTRLLVQLGQN